MSDEQAGQAQRRLQALPIPPGRAGLEVMMPALTGALAGTGPAIGPLPQQGSPPYLARLSAALRADDPVAADVAVVAATSGSTGDPAGVLLPAGALRAAATAFAQRFGRHRWLAALPLHHAGGLMVAVRSLADATIPIALPSLGGAEPFTVAGFAAATEVASTVSEEDGIPLAVSLVPAMLAVLDDAGAAGHDLLGRYDVVLVGGAAIPDGLLGRLRSSGARLVTSYGMTETCGGVAFDGLALPGVTVTAGPDGRLAVCADQVGRGYRDGRAAERWSDRDGVRCFRTDDLGAVGADGRVAVAGRADDVVQVDGASVALSAVRAALEADPRVRAAEVVAVPHDRHGASLVAIVVPVAAPGRGHPGADRLADELCQAVVGQLGRPARPRAVHLVPRIPLNEVGKPDRRALAALAAAALPQKSPR